MDELLKVPLTDAVRAAHRAYYRDKDWLRLAANTQSETDAAMCARAVALARADRAEHPRGGVLLVANDAAHVERLLAQLARGGHAGCFGRAGRFEDMADGGPPGPRAKHGIARADPSEREARSAARAARLTVRGNRHRSG